MLYHRLISAHLHSHKIAICDGSAQWTYEELDAKVRTASEVLKSCNVRVGYRLLLLDTRSIDTVIAILACIKLKVCFILLHENTTSEELAYYIQDAEPALIIGFYGLSRSNVLSYEQLRGEAPLASVRCHDAELSPGLVYILYTSGSTGNPKGIMAGESQVLFCMDAINQRIGNHSGDRILCCLPLAFDYGLYQIFLCLSIGAELVLIKYKFIQQLPGILFQYQITGFPAMPAMLNMLIYTRLLQKVSLPDLRYICTTGDALPVSLIEKLMDWKPELQVIPMYGLTECKRIAIMPPGRPDKIKSGSCGLPLDGVRVWLDAPNSNHIGELIVSGPNVMLGYWHDPDTTARYYFTTPDGQHCLRTGDLFRIDRDGFLYFYSRKKRILKVNGYRVGCRELEEKLRQVFGDLINEIRVIGLIDKLSGEVPAVCIYSERLGPEEMVKRLRQCIASWSPYRRPRFLHIFQTALPRSNNGKFDDNALKEIDKNDWIIL